MIFRTLIILVHCCLATSLSSSAMKCTSKSIRGKPRLWQIDAGAGRVFGVGAAGKSYEYKREKNQWVPLSGLMKHVTVGPSGVWGVNRLNKLHYLQNTKWVPAKGRLTQVDAGRKHIAGINWWGKICHGQSCSTFVRRHKARRPRRFTYYSCGPYGCWGVTWNRHTWLRTFVMPGKCSGTASWRRIPGNFRMVEVGTDGNVFGVTRSGLVYRRTGISVCLPAGTGWRLVMVPGISKHVSYDRSKHPRYGKSKYVLYGRSKHVSYDNGRLWVISRNGRIQACTSESFTMKSPQNEAK